MSRILSIFALLAVISSWAGVTHVAIKSTTNALVDMEVPLPVGESLLKDHINLSLDDPRLEIRDITIMQDGAVEYNEALQESVLVLFAPLQVRFFVEALEGELPLHATLYFSYYSAKNNQPAIVQAPIKFFAALPAVTDANRGSFAQKLVVEQQVANGSAVMTNVPPIMAERAYQEQSLSWSTRIFEYISSGSSWGLRLLCVFLLGVLMSMTPCIYPMIPVTIGMLQVNATRSVLANFLMSLSYTLGIATTFAFLGLLASFASYTFGALLGKPWFVLAICALLVYLGLSLIGLYDMYLPRILRPRARATRGGSYLGAYVMGAVSGTFASPCLSPGLVLLLTLVTAWGNKLVGFLVLFLFGLGVGLPLLIIGSFSGAMTLMPRAGGWMVEVKRVCGFIVMGTSLYFAKTLLSPMLLLLLSGLYCMAVGLFYIYLGGSSRGWHSIVQLIFGATLVGVASLLFLRAYMVQGTQSVVDHWRVDYVQALQEAREGGKRLLIDIGAPFCSICNAIDRGLFSDPAVVKELVACVPLRVDGSAENELCALLKQRYSVRGFPTVLLIDPSDGSVIRQWGSELYDLSPQEFIRQISAPR